MSSSNGDSEAKGTEDPPVERSKRRKLNVLEEPFWKKPKSRSTTVTRSVAKQIQLRPDVPEDTSPFDKMPDELLLNIFGNLDVFELKRQSRCCVDWYRVIQDDSFYRKVVVNETTNLNGIVPTLQNKLHVIRNLDLDIGTIAKKQNTLSFLVGAVNVETLTLRMVDLRGQDMVVMALRNFKLKSFSLILYVPSSYEFRRITLFVQMMHLQQIGYMSLQNWKIDCLFADKLKLRSFWFEPHEMETFCLQNSENLMSLKITGLSGFCENVFTLLAMCKNLKSLTLGASLLRNASTTGLQHLSKLKLKSIVIVQCPTFTSNMLIEFFSRVTSLEKITFEDCRIVDTAVLEEILKSTTLKKFVYIRNDDFVVPKMGIVQLVSGCFTLKVLRVSITNLELNFLDQLITAARGELEELQFGCYFENEFDWPVFNRIKGRMGQNYHVLLAEQKDHMDISWFKMDDNNKIIRERSFLKFKKHVENLSKHDAVPLPYSELHWSRSSPC